MRDGVMEFTIPPMHRQVWLRQRNTRSNVGVHVVMSSWKNMMSLSPHHVVSLEGV